jgi:tRNA threonylcarbamoyladenosine biosynthesis protein TsaE
MSTLSFSAVQLPVMEKIVATLAEFEDEAAHFAAGLAPSRDGATLITLSGELGAGKTAFTKAVAKTYGVVDVVTSPTFVLEKIYTLPAPRSGAGFSRLIHIDAYRLDSGSDLGPLGFDELLQDSGNVIILEWPEKVAEALPMPAVHISIVAQADGSRVISYG